MANDAIVQVAESLPRWFLREVFDLPGHACLDKCELLLAAADLNLNSARIERTVAEFSHDERNPPTGRTRSFTRWRVNSC